MDDGPASTKVQSSQEHLKSIWIINRESLKVLFRRNC
jgi:hypothetical protein